MSNESITQTLATVHNFLASAAAFSPVQGFLSYDEGHLLHCLAADGEGAGQIVEIGAFMGLSTCWLASGSLRAGREKVHAVDHFKGSAEHQAGGSHEVAQIVQRGTSLPEFTANLRARQLDQHVVPIVSDSLSAAASWRSGAIRLLFIDGDHSYEATRADFEAWSPYVAARGYVAFHDVGPWPGVTRFYGELTGSSGPWKQVFKANSLRVVQRTQ